MALSAYVLCDLNSVKLQIWNSIAGSTYDEILEQFIEAVSDWIETYCERFFKSRTYTNELYDGNGGIEMWPDQYPVTAITELKISGTVISASADYSGSGYFLYNSDRHLNAPSRIKYEGGFTEGNQNVDLTYTAGFATIPDDLAQACRDLVISAFQNRNKLDKITSERIGNYAYTLGGEEASKVWPVLRKFKRKWAV